MGPAWKQLPSGKGAPTVGLTRRRGNFTSQKRPDGGRRGPARERGGKAQMTDYVCDCTDGGPLATPPRLRVRLAPLRQAQRGKRMNKLGRVQICCKPYGGEPGRSGRSFAPGEQDHPSCTAGPEGWPWSPPDHRLSALAGFWVPVRRAQHGRCPGCTGLSPRAPATSSSIPRAPPTQHPRELAGEGTVDRKAQRGRRTLATSRSSRAPACRC